MKKITTILAALLAIIIGAACTGEDFGAETNGEITLIIPEYPAATTPPLQGGGAQRAEGANTRVSWPTPGEKGQWEDGDKLYITVYYYKENHATIGDPLRFFALRSGGRWAFSGTIQPPAGTLHISVYTNYVVEYNNDPTLNSRVLTSGTYNANTSGTVVLEPFTHTSTRLTFTGLAPGDEVSFRQYDELLNGWCIVSTAYDGTGQNQTIPTLTAGANGTADVYVRIYNGNHNCNFRINGEPSGTDEWYGFNPGSYPAGGNFYHGQHYVIDCTQFGGGSGGSMDLEDIENELMRAERQRFLDWADRCRAVTEGNITEDFTLTKDIDLTGIDWDPIGLDTKPYVGIFDGGGFTITGLKVDTDKRSGGLFGFSDGIIKNLTISGADIKSEGYAGAIAGDNCYGRIVACRAVNCTVKGKNRIGGIVGNSGIIIACHTIGSNINSVSLNNDGVGGITGSILYTTTACVAEPEVLLSSEIDIVGSLVGRAVRCTITACYWRQFDTDGNGTIGGTAIGWEEDARITDVGELTNPDGIDDAAVMAMNAAIDKYNATANSDKKCDYRWASTGLVKAN